MRCTIPAVAVLLTILSGPASRAGGPTEGPTSGVELLRDQWGIPHVFAETDARAMYGLGWATAEDRGLQMYYTLRIIQGRLAESVGDVPHVRRRGESAVSHDRKMRTFGFDRAAEETAQNLDDESRALLQAYADGVNAYFDAHRDDLPELFGELELTIEPWTVADCILSWWHFSQFFATDGTRDLIAWRNKFNPPANRARRGPPPSVPPDDTVAVVKRGDVSDEWLQEIDRFLGEHGLGDDAEGGESGGARETPKFSHAWVVGGRRSTTGSSILVSDPQTPVRNPSLLYEFHISGATFNARGVGVAGSPIILIGFSDRVAWGMTALGADQADLFRLTTDAEHPDQYLFDGEWRQMEVREETIKVKGGPPRTVKVRTTVFGPVVTAFAFARPDEGEVALKRVPVCDTGRDTFEGALAMMRASDVREFNAALAGWRFPSANVVFGDTAGDIGYSCVGALPLRSPHATGEGRYAHDGSASKYDWVAYVPQKLLPQVLNPQQGYLFSANHRPIQSFYRIPIGISTGSAGDTDRSWRLRELLARKLTFSPQDVLDIHRDMVNPTRREIVRLAYHVRDVQMARSDIRKGRDAPGPALSRDALLALDYLAEWRRAGSTSDLRVVGSELVLEINTFFRAMSTDLAIEHGGGQSGLSRMLRSLVARIEQDPDAALTAVEVEFIDSALAKAWQSCARKYGRDPQQWNARARRAVMQRSLGYGATLDGFPPIVREGAIRFPALFCVDGGTIQSQAAQAYTQFVPMHDVDSAKSILPPGQSERFADPSRLSTFELWGKGELHPAPLSRDAVDRLTVSRVVLSRE